MDLKVKDRLKMDIEKIQDYSEELKAVSEKQLKASREYINARRKYSETLFDVRFSLSKVITKYKEEKKNIGIDMAIIMKLRDGDEAFNKAYRERGKSTKNN